MVVDMDWMRSANVNVIVVRSCLFFCVLVLPSVIIIIDSFSDGSGSLRNDDEDVLYDLSVKLSPESLSDMYEG